MISCKEFIGHLDGFLDDELAGEVRAELERHLARCSTCQVVVDQSRKTLSIVTEAGTFDLAQSLPESVTARIMRRIRDGG